MNFPQPEKTLTSSSLSEIMKVITLLFLCLSLFAHQFVAAQTSLPDYCTNGMAAANFYQCIYSNTETCGDCENEDIYENNINFTTCASLTDHVCPFFRCCSACAPTTERFFECYIYPDYTDAVPDLQSCDIDCSAFPYGNNSTDDAEPCVAEYDSWIVCTSKEYESCFDCFASDDQLSWTSGDSCADEIQYFCFYNECCPSCQSEWSASYQCDIAEESASSSTNRTCPLSCNGVNISISSGGFTDGNGTIGGTTSGNVTNGGISSGGTSSGNTTNGGTSSGGATNGGTPSGSNTNEGSSTQNVTNGGTPTENPTNGGSTNSGSEIRGGTTNNLMLLLLQLSNLLL